MFFLSTTCISISQLIELLILAFMSNIPILSSNTSSGKIVLQSKVTSVTSSFNIELIKFCVIDSFPLNPKIRLNT